MKFKICGDLDAPDWLLKEINVVAKLPNLRVKALSGHIIKHILGEPINFQMVEKLTQAAEFDDSDVKALIAALTFIITNGAKYDVDVDVLRNELQQLGMPKEHVDVIEKSYSTSKELLRDHFSSVTFSLPKVASVDWRVDYILASDSNPEINEPSVQLKLGINDDEKLKEVAFEVSSDKFRILLHEKTDQITQKSCKKRGIS